jgi:signal transduction histidine kinase
MATKGNPRIDPLLLRSRRTLALAIVLALAVLAAVVGLTTLQVRHNIREQIAGRDGEVLYSVALMYYTQDVEEGLAGPITDPGSQLTIVLRSAQLRGVLGVRLFDPEGRFVESFPPNVTERALAAGQLPRLKDLRPVSRYRPAVSMAELFYAEPGESGTGATAILEVNVPLHVEGGPLAGIAQFLLEGQSIAAEYARLDRQLARQAGVALAAGGAILSAALAAAFWRLRAAHRLVAERTANLARANQELALAAKTSALGAVTAHLIHGLKNPLAGLQQYVAARGAGPEGGLEGDWQQALASTRRMQAMINQVVGVLREEQSGVAYETTLAELSEIVCARVRSLAQEKGVNLEGKIQSEAGLPNRVANLVGLILVNLVENAVQATPRGKSVRLTLGRFEEGSVMEVQDEGSGFPSTQPLFMPCHSSKEGGTGIGLAVCKQLANHLGADLTLAANHPEGCVFRLRLPLVPKFPEPAPELLHSS